jgi:DNA-directed RNA polymerase subunit RPC12/RpoP
MRRSRRRFFESLFYAAAYRCDDCRLRTRVSRLTTFKKLRYAACPRCGRFGLSVLSRQDHIDAISKNPLRLLFGKFHARLYHCRACRLQFHDIRRRMPLSERKQQRDSVKPEAAAR